MIYRIRITIIVASIIQRPMVQRYNIYVYIHSASFKEHFTEVTKGGLACSERVKGHHFGSLSLREVREKLTNGLG